VFLVVSFCQANALRFQQVLFNYVLTVGEMFLSDNGMGVLAELGLERHPALLCSIYTFGKAAGCHGAVICGSKAVIDYLYNYGRPIIYSTAIGLHSLVTIGCSYESMNGEIGMRLREKVHSGVRLFRQLMIEVMSAAKGSIKLVDSVSPIQALVVPGNATCSNFCQRILKKSSYQINLFPIRSPTVPKGSERVRIIIHAHNSRDQIFKLVGLIWSTLKEMGFLLEECSDESYSETVMSRI
jgi:8-amino-7-oxononanoate synthase